MANMTQTTTFTVEHALLVDWEDGNRLEIVPAQSAEHAERMAQTIYAGHRSWTIQREIGPWCYLSQLAPGRAVDMIPAPSIGGV
jgi:hypothetical protein